MKIKKKLVEPLADTTTVVSFDSAKRPHVHARKEQKLNKVKEALKQVTSARLAAEVKRAKNKKKRDDKKRK